MAVRKKRPITKGLLSRVSFYIRDNAINGVCRQETETMAYHLGMTVELVEKVIKDLIKQGLVIVKASDDPLLPDSYTFIGEGAASQLVLEVGQISNDLVKTLDNMSVDQIKELVLDYDYKVRELIYQMEIQTKEVEAYHSFKDSIVKTMDAANGLIYILARKRP